MKDRSKVAEAIMNQVVEHLRDNPNDTNTDVANAIAPYTDYSANTIRVAIPLAIRMAQAQVESLEDNDLTASDSDKTATRYRYDDFVYTFTFSDAPDATLERRVVKDLVWLYSNRGGKMSKRQAAAKVNELHGEVISEKFLKRIFDALGIQKTSPPFPPHLKDKYTAEELDKMRYARIDAEIELQMNSGLEDKWRKLYERVSNENARTKDLAIEITKAFAQVPQRDVIRPFSADLQGCAVIGMFDLHFGRGGTGEIFPAQLHKFSRIVNDLAAKILSASRPEKVTIILGGDVLHVDTAGATTTSGTAQEMGTTPKRMIEGGTRAVCDAIDVMRTVAPVEIVLVEGNHDRILSFALRTALGLRYAEFDDVLIVDTGTDRAYFSYGANLFMATHGDGVKAPQYASIMASEQRKLWGSTLFSYVFSGHLHHTHEYDINGVTALQCPSIALADTWHRLKGFTTSRAAMRAFLFDKEHGHVGTWVAYPS